MPPTQRQPGAGPRVSMLDPSAFTPPYDRSLAGAFAAAGADVELLTSRFIYGPVPPADGYRVEELFYRRSSALDPASRLRLPLKAAEHFPGMVRAHRHLARRPPDVEHWQWTTFPPLDGVLLRRHPASHPRVITLHYPLPPPGDAKALSRQRRYLDTFDAVVVHTEGAAKRLREEVGLRHAQVEVIPHGPFDYLLDIPEPTPLAPELAEVSGPVILFFGLLRPYKGVDVLLEAFARVEGAELWIAGMSRMPGGMEQLEQLAARAPGTVRFIPRFIPDQEIPALMERADVLALPYREIEQSGVLHAGLAFRKPMVLGDVGGFGELARRYGAAGLVTPGDVEALAQTLRELIADADARAALSAAADRAVAEELGWEAIAERTLSLYERLGSGSRVTR